MAREEKVTGGEYVECTMKGGYLTIFTHLLVLIFLDRKKNKNRKYILFLYAAPIKFYFILLNVACVKLLFLIYVRTYV